jgi:protein TonB
MSTHAVKVFQEPLPWTVTTSIAAHAAVALALLLRMHGAQRPEPIGIEMLYLGETRAPVSQTVRRHAIPPQEKAEVNEKAEVKAQEAQAEAAPASAQTGPVGVRDGAAVSALERYKYELRLFLESRKIYPETAKRLRQTGRVVVNFKVSSSGDLSDIRLEQPSGSEVLNRAAVELVEGASRFKPFPPETPSRELQLSLPIEYIL